MIKRHGNPFLPVVVIAPLLAFLGIFTLSGHVEQINLVYAVIVAPLLVILGAYSYAVIKGDDKSD